jgi:hypothetical protein
MDIRDRPISPGSPWQNGLMERLIGTVGRECLGRMLIFGESHLGQVLASYAAYYNHARIEAIVAFPILAGLHHQYVWYDFGNDTIWRSRERDEGRSGEAVLS